MTHRHIAWNENLRLSPYDKHVLSRAIMARLVELQSEPPTEEDDTGPRLSYERFKLQQLLERLSQRGPAQSEQCHAPQQHGDQDPDDDRAGS